MMNRIALALVVAVCVLALGLVLRPTPPPEIADGANRAEIAAAAWAVAPPESVIVESDDELDDFSEPSPAESIGGLNPVPLEQEAPRVALLGGEVEPPPATFSYSTPADDFALRMSRPLRFDPEAPPRSKPAPKPVRFAEGHANKSLRNADFPRTHISEIHVDLASPNHWVELTWSGPQATRQETGPFRSSPGAGLGHNDCDDLRECNRSGSNCTPKGTRNVEAFSDYLPSEPSCRFVTWFLISREIAFHSHRNVPRYPASHGCVRLDEHAAQLIHNNSLIGETNVTVGGTWKRGRSW